MNPEKYYCLSVSSDLISYDLVHDLYSDRRPMVRARYRHAAAAINGLIWVVGRRDKDGKLITNVDVSAPSAKLCLWVRFNLSVV